MNSRGAVVLLFSAFVLNANGLTNFFLGKYFGKNLPKNVGSIGAQRVETFTQSLDHFDPTNTASWLQRYIVSDGTANVAFLMLEGEGPGRSSMDGGFWFSMAQEVNAWMFQLEHRFYGESQPFNNLSTDSLKFLSSDQALADAAAFITLMNEKYQLGNVTWVAFGGSYAGSLAAWMRYKYSHLVHAAVSSSGPLKAVVDFGEYNKVVVADYAEESPLCIDIIRTAFTQIREAVANNDTDKITQQLALCEEFTPVDDPIESASFYQALIDIIAVVAQYDGIIYPNVTRVCEILSWEDLGSEMERYGAIIQTMVHQVSGTYCLNFGYNATVAELKDESLDGAAGASGQRQWIYQTCTEFGFYQTTDLTTDVFGDQSVTLNMFTKMCQDVFGDAFDEDFIYRSVNNTNILKGSTSLEVNNVVFVHGSRDPWHKLGVIESSNERSPAIFINGTGHCSDMYPPEIDPDGLVEARKTIRELVLKWISDQ